MIKSEAAASIKEALFKTLVVYILLSWIVLNLIIIPAILIKLGS